MLLHAVPYVVGGAIRPPRGFHFEKELLVIVSEMAA
jgi:hypothetical protein